MIATYISILMYKFKNKGVEGTIYHYISMSKNLSEPNPSTLQHSMKKPIEYSTVFLGFFLFMKSNFPKG